MERLHVKPDKTMEIFVLCIFITFGHIGINVCQYILCYLM